MSLAIITGASSGIGAAFAERLAANGYHLLLVARREDRLRRFTQELADRHGIRAEALAADLTRDADVDRVAARIANAADLELLVNNAGFGTVGRFFEAGAASQADMHRLHVLATVRLTHAALRAMVARKKGGVVNVSSVAGFAQNLGNTSYCATKTWMNSFTEGLYMELKSIGSPVRVQALCPGYTYSEFHDVMGVDRKGIPKGWWLSADDVVSESLCGLAEDKLFVIPSFRYKSVVWLLRLLPRSIMRTLAPKYAIRYRGKI